MVLIVKGGDAFVDAAGWMAEVSGIPPFIVGATVVSLATTLPEMLVSVIAAAKGQVEMAAGNAIGSVTANTGLILAIAVIAMAGRALPISAQCLRLDLPFCLAVSLVMLLPMLLRQRFSRWQGWAALAVYAVYLWLTAAGC